MPRQCGLKQGHHARFCDLRLQAVLPALAGVFALAGATLRRARTACRREWIIFALIGSKTLLLFVESGTKKEAVCTAPIMYTIAIL